MACGNNFINSEIWENCDFSPSSKKIKSIDLLSRFPYESETFDLIYCSHFIEHVSIDDLNLFFNECNRVLKFGGFIRLVLPDFENIVSEYIKNINEENQLFSQFNIVELIDQCTRKTSGGELQKWRKFAVENEVLANYITLRTGLGVPSNIQRSSKLANKIKNFRFKKLIYKTQRALIYKFLNLTPKWFQKNHVIRTETGERHLWVHDFESISVLLSRSRFKKIKKVGPNISQNLYFPTYPLDVNDNNQPQRGTQSMYIEAEK